MLWASPSADTVIVDWGVAKNTEPPGQFGVVSHGKFTPLPSVPSFLPTESYYVHTHRARLDS